MDISADEANEIYKIIKSKLCPIQAEVVISKINEASRSFFSCDCGGGCMCESAANAYGGKGDNMLTIDMHSLSEETRALIQNALEQIK